MKMLFALGLGYGGMQVLPFHPIAAYFMMVVAGCMAFNFIADEG